MNSDFSRTSPLLLRLPPPLAQMISGYTPRRIHIGQSAAKVFRLDAENKDSLYLKIAPRTTAHSLLREKTRLEWLVNRLPAPEILSFAEDENTDYLLLSAISGVDASDDSLKTDIPRIIEQSVEGLKMIHALPIENCPFDERIDYKIELAKKLMENNLVDEDDFDESRRGRTAEDLFRELIENKPAVEDLVFTHGDYCTPNIIFEKGRLKGFVDWGNAGVADRYQDIALLTRSVVHNFGSEYEPSVFKIYGVDPDRKKIYFYRLLDEFLLLEKFVRRSSRK
ncbi:MAG TPA: APH(3') family aminoglycoside O-phosphotransferase [Pyrinomonadaceae bacterium]|jgi:aminoglycoside phosphotransferase